MQMFTRRPPYRTYSITQLCREFQVTPRALRFYEEQGLLYPQRNGQSRIYSYRDRARVQLIVRGRRVGLSVANIRQIFELYDSEGEVAQSARALALFQQRIAELETQRTQVQEAIEALQAATRRLASRHPEAVGAAA